MALRRGIAGIAVAFIGLPWLPSLGCGVANDDSGSDAAFHRDAGPSFDAKPDGKRTGHRDATTDTDVTHAGPDAATDGANDALENFDAFEAGVLEGGDAASCGVCEAGTTCCGGPTCVDTNTDAENCGGCAGGFGSACDQGEVCNAGICVVDGCAGNEGQLCPSSAGVNGRCCQGTCGSLTTDNCLGCGAACPTGSTCARSAPQYYECTSPDGGTASCKPDAGCPAEDICFYLGEGVVACIPTSCGPGSDGNPCKLAGGNQSTGTCCNQVCVDTTRDDDNCGGCAHACTSGSFCDTNDFHVDGFCAPSPTCGTVPAGTDCPISPGIVGGCCGAVCLSATSACTTTTCSAGYDGAECPFSPETTGICCGSVCANVTKDPNNCNACATVCTSGECVVTTYASSRCVPPAGGASCAGGCITGQTCVDGECMSNSCSGFQALSGLCVASDGEPGVCCSTFNGFNGTDATCEDVVTDPQNCGGCGLACPAGQTCANGVCSGTVAACGPAKFGGYCDLDAGASVLCCATGCTDISSDPNNCNGCGRSCATGHACKNSVCQ